MKGIVEEVGYQNNKPFSATVIDDGIYTVIDIAFTKDGDGYWHHSGGGPWKKPVTGTQTFNEFIEQYDLLECDDITYCSVCDSSWCGENNPPCRHLFWSDYMEDWCGIGGTDLNTEQKIVFLETIEKMELLQTIYTALKESKFFYFDYCSLWLDHKCYEFEEYSAEEFVLHWLEQVKKLPIAKKTVMSWMEKRLLDLKIAEIRKVNLPYHTSIDAAMTLRQPGWYFEIEENSRWTRVSLWCNDSSVLGHGDDEYVKVEDVESSIERIATAISRLFLRNYKEHNEYLRT